MLVGVTECVGVLVGVILIVGVTVGVLVGVGVGHTHCDEVLLYKLVICVCDRAVLYTSNVPILPTP